MFELDELFERYAVAFSKTPPYTSGSRTISLEDFYNQIQAEVDSIIDDYGSLIEYAEPDDEKTLLELYSINEVEFIQRTKA